MRLSISTLVAGASALLFATPARCDLNVVVTIKPIHALVAGVMAGAGTPRLLVDGNASPHAYALKPSDGKALNEASVFFRVSESLEPFTARLVRSLPKSVRLVTLEAAPGLLLLDRRATPTFESHAHGKAEKHDHDHAGGHDSHVWLDPTNAKALVTHIAAVLGEASPPDRALFEANAVKFTSRIDALSAELARDLKPVAGRPYVVFHDAYQYFEARFGLTPAGAITVSPEVQPGPRRLAELRRKVQALGAVCIFAEPQFPAKLIQSVAEGTRARGGTLDPEGGLLTAGPELYFELMRKLASDFKSCLAAG